MTLGVRLTGRHLAFATCLWVTTRQAQVPGGAEKVRHGEAARNAARHNRHREETAVDEAAAAARREQQRISTADEQKVQLGFRLHILGKF